MIYGLDVPTLAKAILTAKENQVQTVNRSSEVRLEVHYK